MNTANKLDVINLSCIRQQKTIFAGLSFSLKTGEALLVEGQNGAGKSSLLRLLSGLSSPAQGEIRWRDANIQDLRQDYAEQIHFVGHANGIKLGLTIAENIQLIRELSAAGLSQSLLMDIIAELNLQHHLHTPARFLSAGQKRRLALLKLFIHDKPLWLVDEPLTALDIDTQAFFLTRLSAHLRNGGMCVLSSHQPITLDDIGLNKIRLGAC